MLPVVDSIEATSGFDQLREVIRNTILHSSRENVSWKNEC
jgi:hypothetical protein